MESSNRRPPKGGLVSGICCAICAAFAWLGLYPVLVRVRLPYVDPDPEWGDLPLVLLPIVSGIVSVWLAWNARRITGSNRRSKADWWLHAVGSRAGAAALLVLLAGALLASTLSGLSDEVINDYRRSLAAPVEWIKDWKPKPKPEEAATPSQSKGREKERKASRRVGADATDREVATDRDERDRVPELIEALKSHEPAFRSAAMESLAGRGNHPIHNSDLLLPHAPELLHALEEEELQWNAIEALGRLGPSLTPVLQDKLESRELSFSPGVIRLVQRLRADALPLLPLLLEEISKDSGRRAQIWGRRTLIALGAENPETISGALNHESAAVRAVVVEAVGALVESSTGDPRPLIRMLEDRDKRVRDAASRALARTRGDTEQLLLQAYRESGGSTRASYLSVLGSRRLESKETVDVLLEALADSDPEIRRLAAESLGLAIRSRKNLATQAVRVNPNGGPMFEAETLERIAEMLQGSLRSDDSPTVRAAAARALGQFGSSDRWSAHRGRADNEQPVVPSGLVSQLLRTFQEDEVAEVRRAAFQGLVQIRPDFRRIEPTVLFALEDPLTYDLALFAIQQYGSEAEGSSTAILDAMERATVLDCVGFARALQALSGQPHPRLLGWIESGDARAQKCALTALVGWRTPIEGSSYEPGIRACLEHEDRAVAMLAMRAAMKLASRSTQTTDALLAVLNHSDRGMRYTALHSLISSDLDNEKLQPALEGLLDDADAHIRLEAAGGLLRRNPEHRESLEIVQGFTDSTDRKYATRASQILAQRERSVRRSAHPSGKR